MTLAHDRRPLSLIDDAELPAGTLRGTLTGPACVIAYATHPGLRRNGNRDHVAVRVGPDFTALVVADGVGRPLEAGEAAVLAAEVAATTGAYAGSALLACDVAQTAVIGHFADAPRSVQQDATSTLVVAVIGHRQGSAAEWIDIGWLGDSSVWQVAADGEVERLTTPHNPPHDEHFVLRHVADGAADLVTCHLDERPVRRVLVCSDGLDGYVDHEDLAAILAGAEPAERTRDLLVQEALEAGGRDNMTVIVADIHGEPGRGYVEACPLCGRADPGVITRGDTAGTVVTACCEAEV